MFHWFCGLYVHLFDKVQEEKEAKYHQMTRFALHSSQKGSIWLFIPDNDFDNILG